MKQIEKDINKIKKSLILKARKKGLYENFGQKEVRKLRDKYPMGYMDEEKFNMNIILDFSEWCRNINDKDIN
jgi:hypothetical protein